MTEMALAGGFRALASHVNPFGLADDVLGDVQVAAGHVDDVVSDLRRMIGAHGGDELSDRALDATKSARLATFDVNKLAQQRLQPHFLALDGRAEGRTLQAADAMLEELGWGMARKSATGDPKPVVLANALRDAAAAQSMLRLLAPA